MDPSARSVLVGEARELLLAMEAALLLLDKGSDPAEALNAAFRAAHTIKGAAGMFDLQLITSFTQTLESVLESVRRGDLQVDAEFISTLLRCCDYLGALVDAIEQETEHTDPKPDSRAELLGALHAMLGSQPTPLARSGARPANGVIGHWHFSLRFGPEALRNGMDPIALISYLRGMGTILYLQTRTDELPSAEQMDPELCYLAFELGLQTTADRATLEGALEFMRQDCDIRILPPHSRVAEYIQVLRALPDSSAKLGELLVASGALGRDELDDALAAQASHRRDSAPRLGEVLVTEQLVAQPIVTAALDKQRHLAERRGAEQRVLKIDAGKLDQLINLVGELVIASEGARLIAEHSLKPELIEAMGRLGPVIEQVRDRALSMRMIAIGEVFQRFPRVVRDVAKELGKEIELTISGAESELDKSLVDKLFDPLLHIVRNAIDHGIEPVAERVASGKRPQGRLRLHAFHDSGCSVIDVIDDGRGLQREKILAKAIERGLVSPSANLTDAEVYKLIFLPGFSTAQQVTSLSGRGVGMDVVKRSVEQLRGEVELASKAFMGTRMRIRLPLTLAIIDGFRVAVEDAVFVIPLESVVECLSMSGPRTGKQTIFSLRGEPLPYLRLREVFRLAPCREARESLIVVSHGQRKVGLVVDRLLGQTQAVIRPLGHVFRGSKTVTSSTILGDGTVALILDVAALVARADDRTTREQSARTDMQ